MDSSAKKSFPNESRQAIIQCPSCQTKFALESELLTQNEAPRFHCSRCDHVFIIEEKGSSTYRAEVRHLTSEEQMEFEFPDEQAPHEQLASPAMSSSSNSWLEGTITTPPPFENGELPLRYNNQQTFTSNLPYESGKHIIAGVRISERWSGLISLLGPLLLFMTVLVGLSYTIKVSALTSARFERMVLPEAPQVPPPGVHIKNTRFKQVNLESGDTVFVVMGDIANDTHDTFREMYVEGLAFDKNGRLIARNKVNAASTLAKTRIKSLSPEMIQNVQEAPSQRATTFQAGQRYPFAVAFLPGTPALAKARYFSARVYSVIK